MALLVLAVIVSTLALQQATVRSVQPAAQVESTSAAATEFLNYRATVMAYMTSNPTFTGSIPSSALTALNGQQFSSSFLASAGNAVTVAGNGRQITVYAALPTGSLQAALQQSGNDASIGIASGTSWTSAASGLAIGPQPLAVTVASGDVVYVFETRQ